MDKLGPAATEPENSGEVRRRDGGPALGHPHEPALQHAKRSGNEGDEGGFAAGRRAYFSLGHGEGDGAGKRVPHEVGLPEGRGDHLGQNESAAEDY